MYVPREAIVCSQGLDDGLLERRGGESFLLLHLSSVVCFVGFRRVQLRSFDVTVPLLEHVSRCHRNQYKAIKTEKKKS